MRETYIESFTEPKKTIRGGSRSPEGVARKAPLRGKLCCAESSVTRKALLRGRPVAWFGSEESTAGEE